MTCAHLHFDIYSILAKSVRLPLIFLLCTIDVAAKFYSSVVYKENLMGGMEFGDCTQKYIIYIMHIHI